MIRKMVEADIPELQKIDKICFNTKYQRRSELMKTFADEKVSLVYEYHGKIAGYIFNHVLGSFAWFGTLGVHPDYRGKNIGKELVKESIDIFHNEFNVKNIGLVTMPESSYNIGFYLNLGFSPKQLALRLSKDIDNSSIKENIKNEFRIQVVDIEDSSEYKKLIDDAKGISGSLYKDLDMSPEVEAVKNSHMGTGFIIYEKSDLVGFGVLRNKTVFEDNSSCAHIRLLCLKSSVSSYEKAIDALLNNMYSYAASNGLNKIFIDVNTVDYNICSHLMKNHGFAVDRSSLTLIMGDENFYSKINGLIMFRTVS